MAEVKISRRYAKGLFDFAKNANQLQEVYKEIKEIFDVLKENSELKTILSSPILDEEKKMGILKEIFKGTSQQTLNFLTLLTNKGRVNLLEDVANQFIIKYNQEIGKSSVTLILAEDLAEDLVTQILIAGKKQLSFEGKDIEINKKIDPSIIGGFILRINDKQIDASIKNRLSDLREKFDVKLYESHI